MRPPCELNETELRIIATRVRVGLDIKMGVDRVRKFFNSDRDVALEFIRTTYLAVREKLEETQ